MNEIKLHTAIAHCIYCVYCLFTVDWKVYLYLALYVKFTRVIELKGFTARALCICEGTYRVH